MKLTRKNCHFTVFHQSRISLISKHTTDTASISVVVQPVPDSVLVQVSNKTKANSGTVTATTGALAFDYTRHDSLEAEIELRKSEPLPFSSKRSMFSTGKVAQVHVLMHNICTVYAHIHVHVYVCSVTWFVSS